MQNRWSILIRIDKKRCLVENFAKKKEKLHTAMKIQTAVSFVIVPDNLKEQKRIFTKAVNFSMKIDQNLSGLNVF